MPERSTMPPSLMVFAACARARRFRRLHPPLLSFGDFTSNR